MTLEEKFNLCSDEDIRGGIRYFESFRNPCDWTRQEIADRKAELERRKKEG